MNTSRIISTKAILWHCRPDTDPPHLRSKRRMAPSELYMTTENSTSIRSSTSHLCPKYHQSSKNSEENHCSASSISRQDIITFASLRRTHTKPALKQTKDYSNGLSCHSDYATPQPLSRGCLMKSSVPSMPNTQDYSGIIWTTSLS